MAETRTAQPTDIQSQPLPEPKPDPGSGRDASRLAEQLFVSPRVVDQRTFLEYSETLRELVADATAQSRSLIATSGDVRQLTEQLRKVMAELQKRVETAVKVVPTLDQRSARIDDQLKKIADELSAREAAIRELSGPGLSVAKERIAAQVDTHLAALVHERSQSVLGRLAERELEARLAIENVGDKALERAATAGSAVDVAVAGVEARCNELVQTARASSAEIIAAAESRAALLAARAADSETLLNTMLVGVEAKSNDLILAAQKSAGEIIAAAEARAADLEASAAASADAVISRIVESRLPALHTTLAEFEAKCEALKLGLDRELAQSGLAAMAAHEHSLAQSGIAAEQRVTTVLRETDAKLTAAQQEAGARLQGIVDRADQRLTTILARVPDSLLAIEERAGSVVAEIERRLAKYKKQSEEVIESVRNATTGEDAQAAIRRAEEIARISQSALQPATKLAEAAAQAESILPRAEALLAQLDALSSDADRARELLSELLLTSAGGVESLGEQMTQLRSALAGVEQGLAQTQTRAAELDSGMITRAEQCRESLEEAAKPVVTQLARQVQHMGRWLSDLMLQARDLGAQLETNISARGVEPARLRTPTPTKTPEL